MAHIYKSLKESICPLMVSKASQVVGEKEANIKEASESVIASLLGVMVKRGDTQQIKNILNEASNLNILADADNICRENPTEEQRKISDDFLQHLLGDKAVDFTHPIAAHSGISNVAANRLIYMITPLVAGHLGDLLQKDHRSLATLIEQIKEEKSEYASFIPSGLAERFRLYPAEKAHTASHENVTSRIHENVISTPLKEEEPPQKKKSNWLMWLIGLLLLVLLFFWWKSCQGNEVSTNANDMAAYRDTVTTQVVPATPIATSTTADGKPVELTLPNGQIITVLKGGIEEKMVNFLNSDAYKNATENDLKNKWFEFDNIDFEYNSATQFMEQSKTQLNNVMAIIKSYPETKIVVAGFADKKGTEEVNMEISKERALTIEKYFEKEGLGKQVTKIEGFGEKHATRSAEASDSERAKDRDIALRFVK